MDKIINKKKIPMNLMLDAEIAEWISLEAQENKMTLDEIVESLVTTVKCMWECKDLVFSEASILNDETAGGDIVS